MGFTDRDWPDGPSPKDKAGYTKGPWHTCQKGKCSCKYVWADDHPIAKVVAGKWGDDFCSIRIVGNSSLDLKAEAFMNQITYGEIPEKTAIANAQLIAISPGMAEWITKVVRQDFVVFPEDKATAVSILAEVEK